MQYFHYKIWSMPVINKASLASPPSYTIWKSRNEHPRSSRELKNKLSTPIPAGAFSCTCKLIHGIVPSGMELERRKWFICIARYCYIPTFPFLLTCDYLGMQLGLLWNLARLKAQIRDSLNMPSHYKSIVADSIQCFASGAEEPGNEARINCYIFQ